MMSGMSEKDRKALRFGGFGVVGIVLVMFVLFPLMDYWAAQTAKLESANKKIQNIERDVNDAVAASLTLKDLQTKVTMHPDPSSLNQQTALMLGQLRELPGYKGLGVSRLEGLPLRNEDKFYRSAVSVQFTGTLPRLHQLLKEVEEATPALKVERLSVSTDRKNPERIEGQMVVSAYAVVARKGSKG